MSEFKVIVNGMRPSGHLQPGTLSEPYRTNISQNEADVMISSVILTIV